MAVPFRAKWGKKVEFILTCVAYSIGLGNVWRFPYLVFKNGGGAFLIPYWLTQIFVGIPIYFMELSFGQFASQGPITIWKIDRLFKGIGISMVLVCAFIVLYYNVVVAYICFYFFSSMQYPLPWSHCNHYWSSPNCVVEAGKDNFNSSLLNMADVFGNGTLGGNGTLSSNLMNGTRVTPTEDYFNRFVLQKSSGLEDIGGLNWKITLCLLLAWIVVFLVLIKGIRSLGKVVYFTATFPYALLIAIFIRSALLPGAKEGMLYFVTPRWERLKDASVWCDAATQVFFSLGLCMGGLNIMASFNKFKNNSFSDSLLVPCVDCLTSFLCGLVVFSVLGFMAHVKGVSIEDVAVGGPGLAFVAYPEAVGSMPAPTVWAVLFFFMMTIIGFSSQFSMVETVISSISDQFASVLRKSFKRAVLFRFCVCMAFFVLGLPMTTGAGIYILNILDSSVGGIPLLIIGASEIVAIMYIYGYRRFSEDLAMMLGKKPSPFFKFCWCFMSPVILVGVMIFKAVRYTPLSYADYIYPMWAQALGYLVMAACIIFIPGWFLVYCCKHGGCKLLSDLSKPTPDWGPSLPENRTGRYATQLLGTDKQNRGNIPSIVVSGVEEHDRGISNSAFDQEEADVETNEVPGEFMKGSAMQDLNDSMEGDGDWNTCKDVGGMGDGSSEKGMDGYSGSFRGRIGDSFKGRAGGSIRSRTDGSFKGGAVGSIKGRDDGTFMGGSVKIRKDGSFKGRADGSVRSRAEDIFKGRTDGSNRNGADGTFTEGTGGSMKNGSFNGRADGTIKSRRLEDVFKGRSDGSIRSRSGSFKGISDGNARDLTDATFKGGIDGSMKMVKKAKPVGSVRSRNGISVIEVAGIQGTADDQYDQDTSGSVKSKCVYSLDDVSDVRAGNQANAVTTGDLQSGTTIQAGEAMKKSIGKSGMKTVYGLEDADVNKKTSGMMKQPSELFGKGVPDTKMGKVQGGVYGLEDPITSPNRYSADKAAKSMGVRVFPLEDASGQDGTPVKASVGNMRKTWEDKTGIKGVPTGSVRSLKRRSDMPQDNTSQLPMLKLGE